MHGENMNVKQMINSRLLTEAMDKTRSSYTTYGHPTPFCIEFIKEFCVLAIPGQNSPCVSLISITSNPWKSFKKMVSVLKFLINILDLVNFK